MKDEYYRNSLYKLAIKHWGEDLQFGMMNEEMSELTIALNKFRRGSKTRDDVITELADVQIMLEQMKVLLNVNKTEFELEMQRKLDKLEHYMVIGSK